LISQQTVINNNSTTITEVLNSCGNLAYTIGTEHAGLTGGGAISIAGLIGMLITITTDLPNPSDQVGNPPYLWNRGWVSINNSEGMLDEKRITRINYVWLPPAMALATVFEYWLPAGLVLTAFELLPAPH
jgi:hypothetical protein